MRIVLIVHGFPPSASGGTELYADAHARELRRRGDDVLVVTREQDPNRDEYAVRSETRDGFRVVWINNTFRNARSFTDTYRNDAIEAAAMRVIDEFRPDVAHVHHLTCLSTTIVTRLRERSIPVVATLHDYWLMCHRGQLYDTDFQVCAGPDDCRRCVGAAGGLGTAAHAGASAVRALERRLPDSAAQGLRAAAERAAAMMANPADADDQHRRRVAHMRAVCGDVTEWLAPSHDIRDRFVRFGVPASRIRLSSYGVDPSPFRRAAGPASNRLRVGYLGSLMASKGPHVLLEAVRRLPAGTVSVDIFGGYAPYHGDDRYRETLEPLLRQDGVTVHGALAHERVPEALASIDVLVVPSVWSENSPFVVHEAFLAGLPVIASRIGGIPELVVDGKNGLLFEPGDAADLARALARLGREPHVLAALRASTPQVRTLDDDVTAVRALYQRLAAPRPTTKIAAVVLNYGTPDETFLAVRSLLASRHPLVRLIVVDNDEGSDDRLREALGPVSDRVTVIRNRRNLGFSGGMNVGIREALARGADAVLLVNSDVIAPPDSIDLLKRALQGASGSGIAGPVVLRRSEPDRIASLGMRYVPSTGRMRHVGFGERLNGRVGQVGQVDAVSGCFMLVRREVFEAIGLLDEDYFF
ncbi:MAG TPA: glycosyltransferase, partial [Vicinamibacterales bacterium]|nr:glycosyltransferase [Vicinamibacterales bacterium]